MTKRIAAVEVLVQVKCLHLLSPDARSDLAFLAPIIISHWYYKSYFIESFLNGNDNECMTRGHARTISSPSISRIFCADNCPEQHDPKPRIRNRVYHR